MDAILVARSWGGGYGTVQSSRFTLAMGLHDSETSWGKETFSGSSSQHGSGLQRGVAARWVSLSRLIWRSSPLPRTVRGLSRDTSRTRWTMELFSICDLGFYRSQQTLKTLVCPVSFSHNRHPSLCWSDINLPPPMTAPSIISVA